MKTADGSPEVTSGEPPPQSSMSPVRKWRGSLLLGLLGLRRQQRDERLAVADACPRGGSSGAPGQVTAFAGPGQVTAFAGCFRPRRQVPPAPRSAAPPVTSWVLSPPRKGAGLSAEPGAARRLAHRRPVRERSGLLGLGLLALSGRSARRGAGQATGTRQFDEPPSPGRLSGSLGRLAISPAPATLAGAVLQRPWSWAKSGMLSSSGGEPELTASE